MSLSWNEIKTRAVAFTNEWKDEVSEDAQWSLYTHTMVIVEMSF